MDVMSSHFTLILHPFIIIILFITSLIILTIVNPEIRIQQQLLGRSCLMKVFVEIKTKKKKKKIKGRGGAATKGEITDSKLFATPLKTK